MQIPKLNKSAIIFIIVIILLEAANIGLIFYLLQSRKNETSQAVPSGEVFNIGQESVSNEISPGTVGELEQSPKGQEIATGNSFAKDDPIIPSESSLPSVVFNTQGKIISLQEDGITVDGNGSNFEDQLPRQIKARFDDKTVVSEKGGAAKYTGLAGLKYLAVGDQISLSSGQNIRGKIEFVVKYVNEQ